MKRKRCLLLMLITGCAYAMHDQPGNPVFERMIYGLYYTLAAVDAAKKIAPYAIPVAAWVTDQYLMPDLITKGVFYNPQSSIPNFLISNTCMPLVASIQQYRNRKEVLPEQRYSKLSYVTPAAIAIALGTLSSNDTWTNAFFKATCKNIPALGYAVYAMFQERADDNERKRREQEIEDRIAREDQQEREDKEMRKKFRQDMEKYPDEIPEALSISEPWVQQEFQRDQKLSVCLPEIASHTVDQLSKKIDSDRLKVDNLINQLRLSKQDVDIHQFNNLYNDLLCAYGSVIEKKQSFDQEYQLHPLESVYAHIIMNVLTNNEAATLLYEDSLLRGAVLIRFIKRHKKDIELLARQLFDVSGNFAIDLHDFVKHSGQKDMMNKAFERMSSYIIRNLQRRIRQQYYPSTK